MRWAAGAGTSPTAHRPATVRGGGGTGCGASSALAAEEPVERVRDVARVGRVALLTLVALLAALVALAGELPLAVLARRLPLAVLRPLAGGLVVRRARREGDVELERLAVADDGKLDSAPAARSRTNAVSDSAPPTGWPSMATITSPERMPASAAGEPSVTSWTSAPRRVTPSAVAVASASVTPRNACSAVPLSTSCWPIVLARFTGMANPRPIEPDCVPPLDSVAIDDVMPMTRPCASNSGPPELPGLIAASIWIALVTTDVPPPSPDADTGRSTADTMPVVAVFARPSGLPTARTDSPTVTSSESPSVAGWRSSGASTSCTTARSVAGSSPTIFASNRRPSLSVTWTVSFSAPDTTWLFVTTWPLSSMMTPEPSAPPCGVWTWIATTDGATALVTASQSGFCDDESATGAADVSCCWPTSASDAESWSAPNAPVRPAVPTLARSAAAAAALTTGTQVRRRCGAPLSPAVTGAGGAGGGPKLPDGVCAPGAPCAGRAYGLAGAAAGVCPAGAAPWLVGAGCGVVRCWTGCGGSGCVGWPVGCADGWTGACSPEVAAGSGCVASGVGVGVGSVPGVFVMVGLLLLPTTSHRRA